MQALTMYQAKNPNNLDFNKAVKNVNSLICFAMQNKNELLTMEQDAKEILTSRQQLKLKEVEEDNHEQDDIPPIVNTLHKKNNNKIK
jgi:predicted component of type VI protein secretion system